MNLLFNYCAYLHIVFIILGLKILGLGFEIDLTLLRAFALEERDHPAFQAGVSVVLLRVSGVGLDFGVRSKGKGCMA